MQFDGIYKEYYRRIYFYCFRILQDEDEAKDMAQDCFMRLFEYIESGNEILHVQAWLYKVAFNLSDNRRKRILKLKNICTEKYKTQNSLSDDASTDIIQKEKMQMIDNALKTLKERDRNILLLYQDGLSYNEIADILGMRNTSVGKTLERALKKLSDHVKSNEREVSAGLQAATVH